MISARIIADSKHPQGCRLTTFLLTYPRFIHSELMTHRAFSRNAASSRAIPITRMMELVGNNPALPERWGSNKPGMQAGEPLEPADEVQCVMAIRHARHEAIAMVQRLSDRGLAKEVANRYLEPWAHISVIVSATDRGLSNFFALRASPAAQPEFQMLAYRMLAAYLAAPPRNVPWGSWHIPFDEDVIRVGTTEANSRAIKNAVGRVARVSYNRHEDEHEEVNIALHDRLAAAGHWSPFEHVAYAWGSHPWSNFDVGYEHPGCGWKQYRKAFPDECKSKADLPALLAAKPAWIMA